MTAQKNIKTASCRNSRRKSGLNTYKSHGVQYTYHLDSGLQLPGCDVTKPEVRDAIRQADTHMEIKSLALLIRGFRPPQLELSDLAPPAQDSVAFSVHGAIVFATTAKPGQRCLYHNGDLAADVERCLLLRDRQMYFRLMADFGLLHLRQKRHWPGWTHYFAIRTDMPVKGLPLQVTYGNITPAEYLALVAVDERQSWQSVSRAIRDALATSEADSYAVRDEMQRRGWIEKGRAPQLTELGEALIK